MMAPIPDVTFRDKATLVALPIAPGTVHLISSVRGQGDVERCRELLAEPVEAAAPSARSRASGATDDFGFKAVENPVHIHDLHAPT